MGTRLVVVALLAVGLAVGTAGTRAQGTGHSDILHAIRAGDQERVADLLRHVPDPNLRDDAGATALMHAAAFAPVALLRQLLEVGADPNLADAAGTTALMWATHDADRVRLLIAAKADVNARRADGVTPLVSAAIRGKADVMGLLVAAGADRRQGRVMAPWPLALPGIALTTSDPALREFVDPAELTPARLAAWTPPPLTNWLLTSVFSWRPQPAATRAQALRTLLDAGANPNEAVTQVTLTVPALARVIGLEDPDATRVLVERGADVNAVGARGLTPLMAAAASERGAPTVRLLLETGANVQARDAEGASALDWALRLGDTETGRVLRAAGATAYLANTAPRPAASTPRAARPAIEVALKQLQPAGRAFHGKTGCISCHHQSLPAAAVRLAAVKGVEIDGPLARHPTDATLQQWAARRDQLLVGNCAVFGFVPNATYGLFGLAEEAVAASPVTDAVTSCLSGLQNPDGSWDSADTRPPLSSRDPLVFTALAVRGLQVYGVPGRREETAARIARAVDFVRVTAADDTQSEAFKLLGLVWGGAPRAEIAAQTRRVRERQRTDGGWSQLPTMLSDAYATGQALFALRMAGRPASDAIYRRGVAYLLRTQLDDGTWHVRSRAIGFQPYFETGFPHGVDQFISAAATAWAVMALTHVL
jgi:ankyrin repeat protein